MSDIDDMVNTDRAEVEEIQRGLRRFRKRQHNMMTCSSPDPIVRALFDIIKARGISASQLSELTGYNRSTLCDWFNAHSRPQHFGIRDIANTLGHDIIMVPKRTATGEEALKYLLACVEAHADKFPTPEHMRAHVRTVREAYLRKA